MKSLLLLVLLLCTIGIVLIFNATSADILEHEVDVSLTHAAALRQILYASFGFGFGAFLYAVGYDTLIRRSKEIMIGLTLLLALVFVPGIGFSANGARRWVKILGFSLQPSEFVKLTIPLFYLHCYAVCQNDPKRLLKKLSVLIIPLVLILLEPNNGTVGVIVVLLAALLFLTKVDFRFWALPALIFMLVGVSFALSLPYVRHRFEVFLHPEYDLKGKGHQPHQAKIASGSGGLLGRGPGKSMQKLSYLPEAQNDYIAAIYAEEYGFVGISVLILLYGALACTGFYIAFRAIDVASSTLAAGYTFLLSLQAFLNLAVVSGLIPSTGLNLPFFSQGGSSLMANIGIIGILISVHNEGKACRRIA